MRINSPCNAVQPVLPLHLQKNISSFTKLLNETHTLVPGILLLAVFTTGGKLIAMSIGLKSCLGLEFFNPNHALFLTSTILNLTIHNRLPIVSICKISQPRGEDKASYLTTFYLWCVLYGGRRTETP